MNYDTWKSTEPDREWDRSQSLSVEELLDRRCPHTTAILGGGQVCQMCGHPVTYRGVERRGAQERKTA